MRSKNLVNPARVYYSSLSFFTPRMVHKQAHMHNLALDVVVQKSRSVVGVPRLTTSLRYTSTSSDQGEIFDMLEFEKRINENKLDLDKQLNGLKNLKDNLLDLKGRRLDEFHTSIIGVIDAGVAICNDLEFLCVGIRKELDLILSAMRALDNLKKADIKALEERLEGLTVKLAQKESTISSLEKSLGELKVKLAQEEGKISSLEKNLGELKVKLAQEEGKISSLQKNLAALKENFGSLSTTIQVMEKKFWYMCAMTGVLIFSLAGLGYTISGHEDRTRQLERDNKALKSAIDRNPNIDRVKLSELETRIMALGHSISNMQLSLEPRDHHFIVSAIDDEIMRLQSKYNNSLSGSWIFSVAGISRGYSHRMKISALQQYKQALLSAQSEGHSLADHTTLVGDKLVNKLRSAYLDHFRPEDEDIVTMQRVEFRKIFY